MVMHNPPHPGEVLREMYLEPLQVETGLTITLAAEKLGVTRQTLSDLLNQKSGISVEMAIRLAIAFDTTPEYWLNQQMIYDVWHAKNDKDFASVQRILR